MNKRSVVMVIVLTIVTFGIYNLIWFVKTKNEMNSVGADIPTAWLIIVPIANIWWMWRWSGGVELATRGKMSQVIAFILVFLLGLIGVAIVQAELNKAIDQGMPSQIPRARVA
jgi:cytochrome c biogenesis factor